MLLLAKLASRWVSHIPCSILSANRAISSACLLQGASRYPLNNLQCTVLKTALSRDLVTPVVCRGDLARAFRVVWREASYDSLEAAWHTIALQRRKCDAVVRAHPGVEFFVSSITGMFTKGSSKGYKPRAVFPAISYWMVTSPDGDDGGDSRAEVMCRLREVCARVEIKPITAQRRPVPDSVADISAPLYVVLKDHNSGYIRRRLEHSFNMLGDAIDAHSPSRIVALSGSRYCDHLTSVLSTLLAVHLCTDFYIGDELQF